MADFRARASPSNQSDSGVGDRVPGTPIQRHGYPSPNSNNYIDDNEDDDRHRLLGNHDDNGRNTDNDKDREFLLPFSVPSTPGSPHTTLSGSGSTNKRKTSPVSIRLLSIIILISLFSWFYIEALAGGDIEFVKDHLSMLGLNLTLSVLCLTAALTMIVLTPMPSRFKVLLLSGTFLIVYALKRWDDGETFEAHGAYNMLIFLVIAVPLNSLIQLILLTKRKMGPKQFHRTMVTTVIGTALITSCLLTYYHSIWGQGSLGHQLRYGEQNGVRLCEWKGNNIPFVDLLPNHIQNFWAGPSTCEAVNGIEADWSHDGIITIQCLHPDFQRNHKPTFDILPDTRTFVLEDKVNHVYNHVIHNRTTRYTYDEPVFIEPVGVEAIVANCEEGVSKLLVRVKRQETVLARVDKITKTLEEEEASTQGGVMQDGQNSNTDTHPAGTGTGAGTTTNTNNDKSDMTGNKRDDDGRPNVLVLFMDAVSRRQVHRKLAKTTATLADLGRPDSTSSSGDGPGPQLFEFFRYNAIGFNTNDNSRVLYTGEPDALDPPATPIWKDYFEAGYVTNRVEDNCEDWSATYTSTTTSQYFDHELQSPFCMEPYFALEGNAYGNFKGPYSIVRRCMHGQYVHRYAFDYMTQFRKQYKDRPWFQMGSLIEGHEGTGEVLLTIDEDIADFFKGMEQDGTLDNTIVFFMADHGLHMGINFMFTGNGRIEHVNPYLSIMLPPKLAQKYPSLAQGLLHNQQSLITGHEIYKTLKLLATPGLLPKTGSDSSKGISDDDDEEVNGGSWRRGTLFDETLNPGRTCEEARIPDEFCRCR
ncbi:hypothetical protein DFQ26_002005 [Actinomortierella ambigua]|nr:hypothetical protein DFQ26_002005 [Actinomortierella ambigua]